MIVNAVPEKLLKNFTDGLSAGPRNSQTGGAL
jgi:hypothetical protein